MYRTQRRWLQEKYEKLEIKLNNEILEQVDEFVYLGGLLADYERIPFHSIHFVSGKAHSNNKKEKDIKKCTLD